MQPASEFPEDRGTQIADRSGAAISELRSPNSDSASPLDVARDNALHRAAARAAFNAKPVAKRPSFTLVEVAFTCPGCGKDFPTKTTQWEGKAPDPLPSGLRCDPCAKAKAKEDSGRGAQAQYNARMSLFLKLCPPEYQNTNHAQLPNPAGLQKAIAWLDAKLVEPMQGLPPCSILLHGVSRTGKSRIAFELLKHFLRKPLTLQTEPEVMLPGDLAREIADAYREGKEKLLWHSLVRCPLLILDDLGKEKLTERVEAFLFELLDRRFSYRSATVITTNHVGEHLAARFLEPERGAALVARLKEFCLKVAV